MNYSNNYRQGEVVMIPVKKPKGKTFEQFGFKPKPDNVIIEGELTGHMHAISNGKLYEKEGKIIIEAQKGCLLTHPEHASIPLPQGTYEVKIQVEYDKTNSKLVSKVKD